MERKGLFGPYPALSEITPSFFNLNGFGLEITVDQGRRFELKNVLYRDLSFNGSHDHSRLGVHLALHSPGLPNDNPPGATDISLYGSIEPDILFCREITLNNGVF